MNIFRMVEHIFRRLSSSKEKELFSETCDNTVHTIFVDRMDGRGWQRIGLVAMVDYTLSVSGGNVKTLNGLIEQWGLGDLSYSLGNEVLLKLVATNRNTGKTNTEFTKLVKIYEVERTYQANTLELNSTLYRFSQSNQPDEDEAHV